MPGPEEAFRNFINEVGWNRAHDYLYAERDALRLPANHPRVIANAIATYRNDKQHEPNRAVPIQGDLFT